MGNSMTIKGFLMEHGFISIIVAYAIGSRISILTQSFFDDLVIPILDVDWNNDGESDRVQLSKLTLSIGPIKLRYGRFMICLLNIIISIYVIFFIAIMVKRYYKDGTSDATQVNTKINATLTL